MSGPEVEKCWISRLCGILVLSWAHERQSFTILGMYFFIDFKNVVLYWVAVQWCLSREDTVVIIRKSEVGYPMVGVAPWHSRSGVLVCRNSLTIGTYSVAACLAVALVIRASSGSVQFTVSVEPLNFWQMSNKMEVLFWSLLIFSHFCSPYKTSALIVYSISSMIFVSNFLSHEKSSAAWPLMLTRFMKSNAICDNQSCQCAIPPVLTAR